MNQFVKLISVLLTTRIHNVQLINLCEVNSKKCRPDRGRVKPKTIKFVFVASPLSMQH